MKKLYVALFFSMAFCLGCQWNSRIPDDDTGDSGFVIDRFDQVESAYLTMADYGALSQMRTDYPVQTRMLIEDVLNLGAVNDVDINNRFLVFFQDSTLQTIIAEVSRQYSDLDDLTSLLASAFEKLQRLLPGLEVPRVYTQIGSLDQSIVVGDGLLGISLDKYLGADHPVYMKYGYTERQRLTMTRENIVPDCLCFYLLSCYPLPQDKEEDAEYRHWHISKIQCLVN
ncbi:MAG: gliding motility protein GldB, partial [Prevotella sp.]|nr:gliding motility protein GldB [Prevotella sp.]